MEDIIVVKNLKKTFKVNYREKEGLVAAVGSLFNRKFKTIVAVDNINLNIKQGEVHALIGPNGAGKSTIIKILSGILYPTEGDVRVMGYIPWKQRETYVRNIGVLFGQKGQLTWELPAIDTFALRRQIYKIPSRKFKETLDYFISLFGLQEIVQKPVMTLSLGERMKCEFICALLHEPSLIFLDEPTIGLDVLSKHVIRNFIKTVNKEKGITFILTTHDLNEIEHICNEMTVINRGVVVYSGKLNTLSEHFSNKKIIDLKFSEPLTEEMKRDFNMELLDPYSARFEIDIKKYDFQTELSRILRLLPVRDMNINAVEIETIIRDIYQKKL